MLLNFSPFQDDFSHGQELMYMNKSVRRNELVAKETRASATRGVPR